MKLPTDTMPCRPIWIAGAGENDEYADFYPVAALFPGHDYKLRIAADTDYNVFVDGALIGFGQYSDNPDRLIYDDYGISVPESRDTPSALKITAWHSGIDSQCHIKHPAYVAFALFENGKPVPGGCSDENTPSSFNPFYIQHRCRSITSQLGAGFGTVSPMRTEAIPEAALGHGGFAAKPQGASVSAAESSLSGSASDNNRELFGCSDSQDGFKKCLFSPSSVTQLDLSAVLPRPNRRLVFDKEKAGTVVKAGRFRADAALSDDPGKLMAEALLADVKLPAVNAEAFSGTTDGIAPLRTDSDGVKPGEFIGGRFFIFDLGEETVGYPEISFESDAEACMFVGWGEHLTDGICRTVIGGRRFAFDYYGHRGQNLLLPSFRRLGCRYIQLFISGNPENVSLSFLPVVYPVNVLPSGFDTSSERGALRERIRNTAIHTLRCCMHEHYEDCPWREQSLYTLDSRNQMIAGYRVFEDGNREMVRSSLDLMSRGIRPDGIMQLCFPAGRDYPIPFYSLAWFIQFDEYLAFSDDIGFAKEKLPVLKKLMDSILSRMITSGEYQNLCPRYPESRGIWNFYEWSESMSGNKYGADEINPPVEAPFNALLVLALRALAGICRRLLSADDVVSASQELSCETSRQDISEYAERCERLAGSVSEAVRRVFMRDDGLFRSFSDRSEAPVSVLTQALCVLCGAADGQTDDERGLIVGLLAENGSEALHAVPATLSMACFRYDALLKLGGARYSEVILNEIDRDGKYMLDRGATTFWETIVGEADFSDAGSLCHGWSAMAAYYYSLLL